MATSLQELKNIVDNLESMVQNKGDMSKIDVNFKTFDERFEENSDEFQEPDTITRVELDVKNWDKVTITIERKANL